MMSLKTAYVFDLLLLCALRVEGIVPSVSLTVEKGVSLVGEHCPGTIKLSCEGMDLSVMRWRYNGVSDIYSFRTTDLPMGLEPSNSAFVHVELINVTQTPNDARFARFTSVLIVDIAQLEVQNVFNINCGDPGTIATEPVDVITLQPSVPSSPVIYAVTATYKSGLLMTLNVSWMDLKVACLEFKTSLVYILNLAVPLSPAAVIEVNRTSCRGGMYLELFSNISESVADVYNLSLIARNDIGSSEETVYQIKQRNDQYYTPEITFTSCQQIVAQCVSANPSVHNASCSVSYGTDTSSLDTTTSPINTEFTLSTDSGTSVSYFFIFSLMVTSILRIDVIEEESIITDTCEGGIQQRTALIVSVVPVVLMIVIVIVIVIIVLCCRCLCRRRKAYEDDICEDKTNNYSLDYKPVSTSPRIKFAG